MNPSRIHSQAAWRRWHGRLVWPCFKWAFALWVLWLSGLFLFSSLPERNHGESPITFAKTGILSLKTALDAFEADLGCYPTTAEGLAPLVHRPDGVTTATWRGPYLEAIPLDPWGHPFRYTYPGQNHPETYEITSAGPDGKFDTRDDLTLFNLDGQ